ncbi:MAG: M14 family zinc carboxypeptidase [Solirubrobacteraceae bacterium]
MHGRFLAAACAVALTCAAAPAAVAKQRAADRLDVYTVVTSAAKLNALEEKGIDVASSRAAAKGLRAQLVMTKDQRDEVRADGVRTKLTRVQGGKTVKQFAAAQAANGFTVWRSYDEPGGYRDQLHALARKYPQVTKLVQIGTTLQGREILALKVTQGARDKPDGSRPAVLYSATQHAREWIATEIDRRLMYHYVEGWKNNDKQIKELLKGTELWFVPVMNPDGYQYTFDVERLWRKNLRDNDGDGETTIADGVDPNRNYPEHFKYDEEGSSQIPSSQTFRGSGPASEAETKAIMGLSDRVGFQFNVNYHSNGRWLLYPEGWQVGSPTADDPIYYALSGNLDKPAIEGFHPGLSSDVLYVTNGEANDYVHKVGKALAWTPELSPGCDGCGFVFPDDEALVQEEFERNLPFAESVADSAADPDDPKSSLGIKTKPFYIRSDDPYKGGIPGANFAFRYSYGDPQPVQVLAKRALGAVTVKYRVNGGAVKSATTSEWTGGQRYKPASVYYHVMRGTVTGTSPGDSVEVWFEGGGQKSESFTYQAVAETGNRVLVVAAEDYTGASPVQPVTSPRYLQFYLDALAANGIAADVYDVDARGRIAPDQLGVMSHYDGVIWYTGDDIVTREAGRAAGNADRLALDEMLEMRAYMDEGGRVLYTGKRAGMQYTGAGGVGNQFYDPKDEAVCRPVNPAMDPRQCLLLRGSTQGGDQIQDVLQYWFGGMVQIANDGTDDAGNLFGINGIGDPFAGLSWTMNGAGSANNQDTNSSFVTTSGVLPVEDYPQFESDASARWAKPGGPFDPHSGSQYVFSQLADASYKRLTREIAVPAGGGDLTFWTSYDTEADWDYLTVEARTAGGDDWTTLPDANGNTGDGTGESCVGSTTGWADELHPHLTHYQTFTAEPRGCTPTGTTGVWNAATGSSGGWQQWSIDLDDWAGETVEISVAYISDWGTQNLGVFLDDFVWPGGSTSFEGGDTGGWQITGPPAGSGPNANNWEVTDAGGFPVGAAITTPRSLLFGFGFEGISTAAQRNAVMGRAMGYLLR